MLFRVPLASIVSDLGIGSIVSHELHHTFTFFFFFSPLPQLLIAKLGGLDLTLSDLLWGDKSNRTGGNVWLRPPCFDLSAHCARKQVGK